jgi:hypothetical protein
MGADEGSWQNRALARCELGICPKSLRPFNPCVLALTVPGFEAPEKFKILHAFGQLHHFYRS